MGEAEGAEGAGLYVLAPRGGREPLRKIISKII